MDCQKNLFALPEGHHYLNCSFLSPLLKSVEEAGIDGIKRKARPWKTTPHNFFEDCNTLRSLFARIVNAPSADDIAIMPAVSYGLATVAKNIDTSGGDTIVVTGEQFPSNIYIWKRFCKEHNCELTVVEPPEDFENRGKNWNDKIYDAIGPDTLLVALGNVHWTDGTLFDLKSIGTRSRENGAYFIIDGTQSVGALPFDLQEIKADALICAGYKWLMGPYAMTLGYFGQRLQDGIPLEEGWIVRKGSEDFSKLVDYADAYQDGARRFDMGERSNFILVPMMIEALRQIIAWEPRKIQHYCKELTTEIVRKLPEYGYQIEQPEWRGHHMFGIRLPGHVTRQQLEQELAENNIDVSIRGSAVRISPNVYNDKQDIEVLSEVLKKVS